MANYNPTLTALARRTIAESGLPEREIAARTGIDHSNISNLKRGRAGVGELPARRILAACGYRLVITAEPIKSEATA
jgi:transcriptional regulator with XRE-family HTH domain